MGGCIVPGPLARLAVLEAHLSGHCGNEAPPTLFLRLKFFLELVAIDDVQGLRRLELREQCARLVGVVTVALKIGDDRALTCNMLHALGDVPLRLR